MKTAQQWKACYLEPAFQAQYTYQGKDLGAACSGKETSFLLWSPFADKITPVSYTHLTLPTILLV